MIPQIIYLALAFTGLGMALAKNGEPETGTHSFWMSLVGTCAVCAVLWWGGFWCPMLGNGACCGAP